MENIADVLEIPVTKAEPGMRVAREIENSFGAILVSPGMILDKELIEKLKRVGIERINVLNDSDEDIEDNRDSFIINYNESMDVIQEIYYTVKKSNKLEIKQISEVIDRVLKIKTNRDIVTMLTIIRDVDDYTYSHSINVGLLAMLFACWAGLNDKYKKRLLYAGILHDIGKAKVPDDILNKKGHLTKEEFKIMKKHSIYGYHLVKENLYISNKIARGVLMHHERNNGTGYPFGFKKEKITFIARVLAIVDTYDAMTSDRVYRGHRPPFDVFKLFENDLHSYDIRLSKIFMNNMSQYYLGEEVILKDGTKAEIVFINPNYISKPIVKVGDKYVDLRNSENEIDELKISNIIID
ncbi:MAG: HD-GYP domain-containing protein [Bacillota bacterium]